MHLDLVAALLVHLRYFEIVLGSTHQPRRFPERVVLIIFQTNRATTLRICSYFSFETKTTCPFLRIHQTKLNGVMTK